MRLVGIPPAGTRGAAICINIFRNSVQWNFKKYWHKHLDGQFNTCVQYFSRFVNTRIYIYCIPKILLMHSDMYFLQDSFVSELYQAAKTHPECYAIAPQLYEAEAEGYHGKEIPHHYMKFFTILVVTVIVDI